ARGARRAARRRGRRAAGPLLKDEGGAPDEGPEGPKPGGGKRPRKPKAKAPPAQPPAGPAAREGATPPEERAPGTREKGTPEEPDLSERPPEPQKTEDDQPWTASTPEANPHL